MKGFFITSLEIFRIKLRTNTVLFIYDFIISNPTTIDTIVVVVIIIVVIIHSFNVNFKV